MLWNFGWVSHKGRVSHHNYYYLSIILKHLNVAKHSLDNSYLNYKVRYSTSTGEMILNIIIWVDRTQIGKFQKWSKVNWKKYVVRDCCIFCNQWKRRGYFQLKLSSVPLYFQWKNSYLYTRVRRVVLTWGSTSRKKWNRLWKI